VRALVRRRERNRAGPQPVRELVDGCHVDALNLVVRAADGRAVGITPLQHRLLEALLARPGEVVSREQLLAQVLGEDTDSFDRAIDVHVSRLKKRLAQVCENDLITAYRGVGYRLELAAAAT
jgi:DNA-binding response OmpR family regulator